MTDRSETEEPVNEKPSLEAIVSDLQAKVAKLKRGTKRVPSKGLAYSAATLIIGFFVWISVVFKGPLQAQVFEDLQAIHAMPEAQETIKELVLDVKEMKRGLSEANRDIRETRGMVIESNRDIKHILSRVNEKYGK